MHKPRGGPSGNGNGKSPPFLDGRLRRPGKNIGSGLCQKLRVVHDHDFELGNHFGILIELIQEFHIFTDKIFSDIQPFLGGSDMHSFGISHIELDRRLNGWLISLAAVLICLWVGMPDAAGNPTKEFRVIRFQHEIDLGDGISGSAGPDYLINGGESDGLKVSMLLDVYRPRNIHDPFNNKDYPLRILIGQVKVIRVFSDLAVTRLHALEPSTEKPIVKYRSVMIGDYARLRPPGAAKPATFSLPSNVLFDFDSWRIKPEAQAALLTISEMLKRNPGYGLAIEGHTCNLGSAQYNKILSLKRAAGVAAFIVSYGGIQRERIHFFGYGEASPVASNDTEKGRQQNRRVDFRLIPPGAPIPVI